MKVKKRKVSVHMKFCLSKKYSPNLGLDRNIGRVFSKSSIKKTMLFTSDDLARNFSVQGLEKCLCTGIRILEIFKKSYKISKNV